MLRFNRLYGEPIEYLLHKPCSDFMVVKRFKHRLGIKVYRLLLYLTLLIEAAVLEQDNNHYLYNSAELF